MLHTETLHITPEILTLIARIDEFKGAWRALGRLAPDRLSALRHVATIESIGSSTRIEGNKLSDRQIERLLSNLEMRSFSTRDEQEVVGYANVMELVFHSWQNTPVKEAYYLALRQTQATIRSDSPNWQSWLLFFLRSLTEQVRRLEQKIERENIVLAALPELSLHIVEFVREHGRITMGEAIRLTASSRNTLKQHFRNLVEQGHLNQRGSGRGVWYELR
jgi:Fic family protein